MSANNHIATVSELSSKCTVYHTKVATFSAINWQNSWTQNAHVSNRAQRDTLFTVVGEEVMGLFENNRHMCMQFAFCGFFSS